MLNRRSLRIKVMQSLFSLDQSREANYQLCLDRLRERFLPDLNSMEVQDKEKLTVQRNTSVNLFETSFAAQVVPTDSADEEVTREVVAALNHFKTQTAKDQKFYLNHLISEIQRIYDYYISILYLPVVFADQAAADKKGAHTNFLQNEWIKELAANNELKKESLRLGKHWQDKMEKVRAWFRDILKTDNEYLSYLDKKAPDPDEQRKFMNHLFRKIILGPTLINEAFEEDNIRWAEDREIIKGMIDKSIKSYEPGKKPMTIHTLSVNWEEDKEFVELLYNTTTGLEKEYKDLIAKNTRNWEVDRLPLTDRIILELAIAELISFPNIPVKVTINEYIELAKGYSTPNSRQFINGILDVISKELLESGRMRKSGRGLIDNQ